MEPKIFAFIVHSRGVDELKKLYPLFRMVPDFVLKTSFRAIAPFKVSQVRHVRSLKGGQIQGFFIDCPFLIEEGQPLEDRLVFGKIFSAANIAKKMGAQILGSDSLNSPLKDGGAAISRHLYLPFTNGASLTAWTIFEGIYRIAKSNNIDLKNSTVAVVDATNPVGSLCARKLAEYAKQLIISSNQEDKLETLRREIMESHQKEIIIEKNPSSAIRQADITAVTANLKQIPQHLEKGKVIVYVSLAPEVVQDLKSREGLIAAEAGLIKMPYPIDLQLNLGLPKDIVPAALAETMLLALEEHFVNYSAGENINVDKSEEIADIAAKHGFEVWLPDAPVL